MKLAAALYKVMLGLSVINGIDGASVPTGFSEETVATGLGTPTSMEILKDGRIFVTSQDGTLRLVKDGVVKTALKLTVDNQGERGLLAVAPDPNFPTTPYVYVYHTTKSPQVHNRISRFKVNGDVADPASEVVILDLDNLSGATNHNGGGLHFGPDGKLYLGVGDNAKGSNAQSQSNLLGKMIRINKDGSIPSDNPFYSTASGRNRAIWNTGLRNPYTSAFDPATGKLYVNDVGQNTWEEINQSTKGANYGWPETEGATSNPDYRTPEYSYSHSSGACAITGGTFYNPATQQFPTKYKGAYFFADYCTGWIRVFLPSKAVEGFATGINRPVDLKVDSVGSLYYITHGDGGILKKIKNKAGTSAPLFVDQPDPKTVSEGEDASFACDASGSAPLAFQWQRDGRDISGATSRSYTLDQAQLVDDGAMFRCEASNSFGTTFSQAARLTVVKNDHPVGAFVQPSATFRYKPGQVVTYQGTGTDTEDGTLPASAFTWSVVFHHDAHTHPFMAPVSGARSGQITIPTSGEESRSVYYRIHMTVKDSVGLETTEARDIRPAALNIPATLVFANAQYKKTGSAVTGGWQVKALGKLGDNFNFPAAGNYKVVVRARSIGTEVNWPNLQFAVDGKAVRTIEIKSTAFGDIVFTAPILTAGVHELTFEFNDDSVDFPNRGYILDNVKITQL